jgi:histone H3/H4
MVIVRSKVKEYTGNYRVSADFYATLEKTVETWIKDAQKRAHANGRKTLRPEDL